MSPLDNSEDEFWDEEQEHYIWNLKAIEFFGWFIVGAFIIMVVVAIVRFY